MACTLKAKVGCSRKYEELMFKSLYEEINVVHVGSLEQGKKKHIKSLYLCFEWSKDGEGTCLEQGTTHEEVSECSAASAYSSGNGAHPDCLKHRFWFKLAWWASLRPLG